MAASNFVLRSWSTNAHEKPVLDTRDFFFSETPTDAGHPAQCPPGFQIAYGVDGRPYLAPAPKMPKS